MSGGYDFLQLEEIEIKKRFLKYVTFLINIIHHIIVSWKMKSLIHKNDLDGEKKSKNFLLILTAGKSAHIEAGIAYGSGKI